MTDKTPATEAGRRLVTECGNEWPRIGAPGPGVLAANILAIEAEARAKHSQHDYNAGRADALREAADKYRALKFPTPSAVLAILTEQER